MVEISKCAIALGSNVGDSQLILERALDTLHHTSGIHLHSYSSWYKTSPIGPPQRDYLNGCAILHVQLTPPQLLTALLAIEQKFGRVRDQYWGPRTLDLDLLLYEHLILSSPHLTIPHPRMGERAFVMVPLAEIAPEWIDPVSGKTVSLIAQELDHHGVYLYSPASGKGEKITPEKTKTHRSEKFTKVSVVKRN